MLPPLIVVFFGQGGWGVGVGYCRQLGLLATKCESKIFKFNDLVLCCILKGTQNNPDSYPALFLGTDIPVLG